MKIKTMDFTERINQDIKQAMLAKDKERLAALRDIKSKILLEATAGGGAEVTEAVANKIVAKLYKQRMDTYQIYIDQNRQDLADVELFQAKVIEEYMPKMLSEAEVKAVVQAKIAELNASGMKDMGKVVGAVNAQLAGSADGKTIADLVKQLLTT
jgi:hypothetical protein